MLLTGEDSCLDPALLEESSNLLLPAPRGVGVEDDGDRLAIFTSQRDLALLGKLESLEEGVATCGIPSIIVKGVDRSTFSCSLFRLFSSRRRCRFQELSVVNLGDVTLRDYGQQVGQIVKSDEFLLIEFLLHCDVLALDESALSTEMVEVDIAYLVAERVAPLALLFELILELFLLSATEKVQYRREHSLRKPLLYLVKLLFI